MTMVTMIMTMTMIMMMMMPRWWSQTSAAHRCQLNQCFPLRGLFQCQVREIVPVHNEQGQIVRILNLIAWAIVSRVLIKSNSPEPVSVFVRIRPLIAEEVEDGDQPLQGSCCLYFDSNLTWLMVTGMKIDLLLTFARDGKCFQCSWWWFCCGRWNRAGDSW